MTNSEPSSDDDDFPGLSAEQATRIYRALIEKWFQLMLGELDRDRAELIAIEQHEAEKSGEEALRELVIRAKWAKQVDLLMAGYDSIKKYETPAGELELVAQRFGDQIGLPAQSMPANIEDRLQWYKTRSASEYERRVKNDVNQHKIVSPIEQVFLMEWRFLRVDERYGVTIRPQKKLDLGGKSYVIDFMVESPDGKTKLAIELDGHDFHEKTKEQAANDRARERTIVRHGYSIFRFTGSEVIRNPRQCVQEVTSMLVGAS
jgi:very-short-patch-repair endonuclease